MRIEDMEAISLDKQVPMPRLRTVYNYPYDSMEVGDSFTVPVADRARVLNANYRAWKGLGIKLQAKTIGDVVRTWRVS